MQVHLPSIMSNSRTTEQIKIQNMIMICQIDMNNSITFTNSSISLLHLIFLLNLHLHQFKLDWLFEKSFFSDRRVFLAF